MASLEARGRRGKSCRIPSLYSRFGYYPKKASLDSMRGEKEGDKVAHRSSQGGRKGEIEVASDHSSGGGGKRKSQTSLELLG